MRRSWALSDKRTVGALTILAIVAVLILVFRFLGGRTAPFLLPDPTGGSATTAPLTDDDEVVEPSTSPDDTIILINSAAKFAAVWLRHDLSIADWHDAVSPHCTKGLLERLSGVDPRFVPANRVTATPAVVVNAGSLAVVSIPVDTGRLTLTLVLQVDIWLVDGVDWERV